MGLGGAVSPRNRVTLQRRSLRPLAACLVCLGATLGFACLVLAQAPEPEPISPLPAPPASDPRKVALGRTLFHDPRLSGGGKLSCATCHNLSRGGDDGRPRAVGADDQTLDFNTP